MFLWVDLACVFISRSCSSLLCLYFMKVVECRKEIKHKDKLLEVKKT